MSEWKPIETAPKDGTLVDLFIAPPWANEPHPEQRVRGPVGFFTLPAGKKIAGKRFCNAIWEDRIGWRCADDLHFINRPYWEPTHWMEHPGDPLPEPPKEA